MPSVCVIAFVVDRAFRDVQPALAACRAPSASSDGERNPVSPASLFKVVQVEGEEIVSFQDIRIPFLYCFDDSFEESLLAAAFCRREAVLEAIRVLQRHHENLVAGLHCVAEYSRDAASALDIELHSSQFAELHSPEEAYSEVDHRLLDSV